MTALAFAGVTLLALAVWLAADVLFIIFGGIILSVFLSWIAGRISETINLAYPLAAALVLMLGLGGLVGGGAWIGPLVYDQSREFMQELPQAISNAESYIREHSWGASLIEEARQGERLLSDKPVEKVTQVLQAFSVTFNIIIGFLLALLFAAYFTLAPNYYRTRFRELMPAGWQDTMRDTGNALAHNLRWWMAGQGLSMLILGSTMTIGLWLLDVPMALLLGLLTALLSFIPNLGAILAAIPAILMALTVSPQTALVVAIFYSALQLVESYLVTPLIQHRMLQLPPALILGAQLVLASLVGFVGIFFAMPILVCIAVLVRQFYLKRQ